MYNAVFNETHEDPEFMSNLKAAMTDQKYFLKPVSGLGDQIGQIESLYFRLLRKLQEKHASYEIECRIEVSRGTGEWLRANAYRFLEAPASGPFGSITGAAHLESKADAIELNLDRCVQLHDGIPFARNEVFSTEVLGHLSSNGCRDDGA
jgi:hypothetical protein